jgi:DNA-binding MarR family transcriptional regulator
MDVVPLVMRVIRTELRRGAGLASIPQLRTLGFVDRNPHASLTDVAAHLGVTTATTSALVDRLVRRRLLSRMAHPGERRRIVLSLTRSGDRHLSAARSATRRELARALASASSRDLAAISRGMAHLREIFGRRRDGAGG